MKRFTFFMTLAIVMLAGKVQAQTLYVPSGTGGIGSSTNANVGIGITNPQYKLTVQGEIDIIRNYPYLQFNSTYWNAGSFIQTGVTTASQANGDYMVFYNPASKGFNFSQGSYNAFTINPSGQVGIGTTSPQYTLDVNGTATVNNHFRVVGSCVDDMMDVVNNQTNLGVDRDLIWGYYGSNQPNNPGLLKLQTPQGIKFIVRSNGQVGIGTDPGNSAAILTVKGKIEATEMEVKQIAASNINIKQSNWADDVFLNGYKLMSLSELEKFIQKNNHLPNVPTEAHVKQNGVNLAEMNAILLRKIEELTKYVIEQEKEMQGFKRELEAIKSK